MTHSKQLIGLLFALAAASVVIGSLPLATSAQVPGWQTQTFQQGIDAYAGAVDTYIAESAATTTHGALDTLMWDASTPTGSGLRTVALLWFDDLFGPDVGQIPLDAIVVSAALHYEEQTAEPQESRICQRRDEVDHVNRPLRSRCRSADQGGRT